MKPNASRILMSDQKQIKIIMIPRGQKFKTILK